MIEDTLLLDDRSRTRNFPLLGISMSYKEDAFELYANAVQNYRAINYSDIQIRNTSLVIDPDIQDERGANFDLGVRTPNGKRFRLDVSAFLLLYQDRIGEFFTRDALNRAIRFRSNIADARTYGIECFLQQDLTHLLFPSETKNFLRAFINASLIEGTYTRSENEAFEGNELETIPSYTFRGGIQFRHGPFSVSTQFSQVAQQFSDASNVGSNPDFPATQNAVDGIIPAYGIYDVSFRYELVRWNLRLSLNNITDERYFTRRATGYPGPGIIPSDGRSFHLSVGYRFGKGSKPL